MARRPTLSSFFSAAGLAKKVRASFERAVELDGSNVQARSDLAEFYMEAPGVMGGGRIRLALKLKLC